MEIKTSFDFGDERNRYGSLLTPDLKLFRQWFKEMVDLQGIKVAYYEPLPDRHYTTYGEIKSNYKDPIITGCIFDEYPDQKTIKKMGWVSELQDGASFIHVPYDLPGLKQDALFAIPSGLDYSKGRLFRVVSMSYIMVYPSSITCEIVPEFEDTLPDSSVEMSQSDYHVLRTKDDRKW